MGAQLHDLLQATKIMKFSQNDHVFSVVPKKVSYVEKDQYRSFRCTGPCLAVGPYKVPFLENIDW